MNFECKICNKQYKSNKTLKNHINKFHKDNDITENQSPLNSDSVSNETAEATNEDIDTSDENSDEENDMIQEIMEDTSEETTLHDIIIKILGDGIITNKNAKKLANTLKFVDAIENSFMDVVLQEANITKEELALFNPITPPINPQHIGSVIGCYIKYLRHKLAYAR